jgi:hypothetical protein|tara:strand:- start:1391 stop:2008 length:618 start_codon:yes stop_codon:yes gene_type:complete
MSLKFKLNNIDLTPPCGWMYNIALTNVTIKSSSYNELVNEVKLNLKINNFDIPDNLEEDIQHQICQNSPNTYCKNSTSLVYRPMDVYNGTSAFVHMMRKGKKSFVNIEKAEERAEICSKCPLNVQNPGCWSCKGFQHIVDKVTKGRKTKLDNELKVCGICKCFIKAMVHVDVEILNLTTKKKIIKNKYPDFCWKKKELEEYYEKI